MSTSSHGL